MRILLGGIVAAALAFSQAPRAGQAPGTQPAGVSLTGRVTTGTGPEARPVRRPPEDYLAVALPGVVQAEWMAPEFLQAIRPLATSFALQEGESKTLGLKVTKRP